MAWEESIYRNEAVQSGDIPMDILASALHNLSEKYKNKFNRKPTVAEVLFAINIVLRSTPSEYISDPEKLEKELLI